jgi:hypothetical protein
MMKLSFSQLAKRTILSVLTIAFVFTNSFGQSSYAIQFQDQNIEFPENINTFQWNQMPASSNLDGGYYGWVQFYETPNQATQDLFKSQKLELIEYIPNKTYLFYFPETTSIAFLQSKGVRGIQPIAGEYKLSTSLKNGGYQDWALEGDNILVTLQFHKNVTVDYVISDLQRQLISVKQVYRGSNTIDLSIPNNCLESLSDLPYVKWVELIAAPAEPEDTRGRNLHRSNGLDTQTTAGRDYTGKNIGVLCRDDGIVGPHIDFQGRIDNSFASGTGQSHGDGVSGIMAGAGNLNPAMRGMAAGANLYVVNYVSNFLDSPTQVLINSGTVQITNSSYSDGCNGGYTTGTQRVDAQTKDIPSLLHVFSAGNSNNNNCGYGAGNQWGNITGGHKQGKNVIATANVFFDGSLVNSSSRGPAHDGRIKPDIAANGQNQNSTNENNQYQSFGGTSGAAPGIAGVSAQLYEAYGDLNAGAFPQSALIKATLLNTATDYGNIGPDYKFGWGIVNGLRAAKLIEDGRHLTATVAQGDSNTHTINVPAGTTQVRFMAYWSDTPAAPGASPALVNDLDLVVTDPSAGTHLPWILDPTPNATTLDLPATNGIDRLNNMEQVLLNNPAAGNYDIEISGFNVPVGPQEYFVVYEIISEKLTLTYPNGGESFQPFANESIHWDAVNTTGNFNLEYSSNNGGSWNAIATVNASLRNYAWAAPGISEVGGDYLVRISSGGDQDQSDANFNVAQFPTVLTIVQVCPTEAELEWNPIADAESYDVYALGDKYMELVGSSNTESLTISIADPEAPLWFGVVAKNSTADWVSARSTAKGHPGGLLNCALSDDISMESINNNPDDFSTACGGGNTIISVTIKNNGLSAQSNFPVSYQISGEPEVVETYNAILNSGEQANYEFTTPANLTSGGSHVITTLVSLASDEYVLNNSQELSFVAYLDALSPIFIEPFDVNGVPPSGWSIQNPDSSYTWEERNNIIGSDGNPTRAAYVNNSNYVGFGEQDNLTTDIYDLTNLTNGVLNFDLAKAQYSSTASDVLFVAISTDCGENFSFVYGLSGLGLSTIPDYNTTNNWAPQSANEWRTEQIDLSAYAGEQVIFRFVNQNGNGNSTYIDNIFTDGVLATSEFDLSTLSLYPNPASQEFTIHLGDNSSDNIEVSIVNSLGQQLQQYDQSVFNGSSQANFNVSSFASGLYFITIKSEGITTTKKLLIK